MTNLIPLLFAVQERNDFDTLPWQAVLGSAGIGDGAVRGSLYYISALSFISDVCLQLTERFRSSVRLPEDQKLRVKLSVQVVPLMLRPAIDVNVLKNFVAIDDILWLEIFRAIDRSSIAQGERVVVQGSS